MDVLEIMKLAGQAGAVPALIAVVTIFIRYVAKRDQDLKEVVTNHLTHANDTQQKVVETLAALAEAVRKCPGPKEEE